MLHALRGGGARADAPQGGDRRPDVDGHRAAEAVPRVDEEGAEAHHLLPRRRQRGPVQRGERSRRRVDGRQKPRPETARARHSL